MSNHQEIHQQLLKLNQVKWAPKLDHELRCMCDGLRANPLPTKWTRGAGHPVGQPPYRIPKG